MGRTEELEQSGARQISGGGNNAPFIKWQDGPGFVEGVVTSLWETKYGDAVTFIVEQAQNVKASPGQDEPNVAVEPEQKANVGLQYSALSGVTEEHIGRRVHIAFEGWQKSRQGNRYRVFKVFDLGAAEGDEPEGETAESGAEQPSGTGPGHPDAEGPGVPTTEEELPF